MSTNQPQPLTCGEPSRSQLIETPLRRASQRILTTVPAAAAWIGVRLSAAMSTPKWVGRLGGRNSDTILPRTGTVHPEAEISPALTHRRSTAPPAALAPPLVRTLTASAAVG